MTLAPFGTCPASLPSRCMTSTSVSIMSAATHTYGFTATNNYSSTSAQDAWMRVQHITCDARIENMFKYQSCMVSTLPIIWCGVLDSNGGSVQMYTTNLIIIEGGVLSRPYHAAAHGRLLIRSACVAVASRRQLHHAGIAAACQPISSAVIKRARAGL